MGKILSDPTAIKVLELIRRTPGVAPGPPQRGGTHGRVPVLVRCTSATAAGGTETGHDQCYPAVALDINSLVDEQADGADVWLTVLTDGVGVGVPTADKVYHGLYAGTFDPFPESAGTTDSRPRVFAASAPAGGSSSLTVNEVDGSPSVSSVTEVRFDQADGFVVSTPGAGIARVDVASASLTQNGIVDTSAQSFNGVKTFDDKVIVNDSKAYPGAATYSTFTVYSGDNGGSLTGLKAIDIEMTGGTFCTSYLFRENYDYLFGGSAVSGGFTSAFGANENLFAGVVIIGGNATSPLQTSFNAGFGESGPYTWAHGAITANTNYTFDALIDYDNTAGGNKHVVYFTYASAPVWVAAKTGFAVGITGSFNYGVSGTLGIGATATGGIITSLGSGTISGSNFSTQSANTVLAGPTSGGAATPTFRALVPADMPTQGAVTDLTDSTGGTPSTTLAAVSGTGDDATINDALASLAATINALQAELRAFKAVT